MVSDLVGDKLANGKEPNGFWVRTWMLQTPHLLIGIPKAKNTKLYPILEVLWRKVISSFLFLKYKYHFGLS